MRTLGPAVFVALFLAGIGAHLPAWSADPAERRRARPSVAPCPPLVIEDHGRSFTIEKPPCEDGGMSMPKQEVVPIVAPQRQPAPSSERRTRRGRSEPAEHVPS